MKLQFQIRINNYKMRSMEKFLFQKNGNVHPYKFMKYHGFNCILTFLLKIENTYGSKE